jgi:tetratricopeptide (TPR) repeat protein
VHRPRASRCALLVQASVAKEHGRGTEVIDLCARGLALVSEADDPILVAQLHEARGRAIGCDRNDHDAGLTEVTQAIQILEARGALFELAQAYASLGAIYMRMGQWGDHLRCKERNLEISERLGSIDLLARAHLNLGVHLYVVGDTEGSLRHSRQALAMYTKVCAPAGAGLVHNNLGFALVDAGRLDEAEHELGEARRLSDLCGGLYYRAEAEILLGRVAAKRGDLVGARARVEAALRLALDANDRSDEASARRCLGTILSLSGEHEAALASLEHARAIFSEVDRGEATRLLGDLGRATLRRGDRAQGEALLAEARAKLEALGAGLDLAKLHDLSWI